jgi:hypothetical protein
VSGKKNTYSSNFSMRAFPTHLFTILTTVAGSIVAK